MNIIEARGLRKIYKTKGGVVKALDGLDLSVPEGTVKALLGPNGAGKTTAVKVLTTLITPDAGTAYLDGIDVIANPQETRQSIGVSGQYAAVDENLTGFENLDMIGRLYHMGKAESRARAQELIELFDLSAAGHRPVKGFSGGMRRRIDLAGALVASPRILFLDEPTTGLDPRSRIALWEIIKNLVASGTTLLLTTQYLEEADQLSDDISVIDGGRVIAEGTADELKAQIGGHRIVVSLVDASDNQAAMEILSRHGDGEPQLASDGREMNIAVTDGTAALQGVLSELSAAGIVLHDAGMRRPTLDDVFLTLTGHSTGKEEEAGDDQNEPQLKRGKKSRQSKETEK